MKKIFLAILLANLVLAPISFASDNTSEPQACAHLAGKFKDSCIREVANRSDDPTLCAQIEGQYLRNLCFIVAAKDRQDVTLCDELPTFNPKDPHGYSREACQYEIKGIFGNSGGILGTLIVLVILAFSILINYLGFWKSGLYKYLLFFLPFIPIGAILAFSQMDLFRWLPFFIQDLKIIALLNLSLISVFFLINSYVYADSKKILYLLPMSIAIPLTFLIWDIPLFFNKLPFFAQGKYLGAPSSLVELYATILLPGIPFIASLIIIWLIKKQNLSARAFIKYAIVMFIQILWFGFLPILAGGLIGV